MFPWCIVGQKWWYVDVVDDVVVVTDRHVDETTTETGQKLSAGGKL